MPICLLNSCCCCIDLKKGSLAIGYMDLLLTLCFISSESFIPEDPGEINVVTGVSSVISVFQPNTTAVRRVPETLLHDALITSYIFNTVRLIAVIALLVGLHADKRKPVAAYLIYCVIYLVAFVTLLVVGDAIVYKPQHFIHVFVLFFAWVIAILCLFTLLVLVQIYLVLLIRSERIKLQNETQEMQFSNHLATGEPQCTLHHASVVDQCTGKDAQIVQYTDGPPEEAFITV